MLKSQTVAEKTAKKFKGPLFSAAPCTYQEFEFVINSIHEFVINSKTAFHTIVLITFDFAFFCKIQ